MTFLARPQGRSQALSPLVRQGQYRASLDECGAAPCFRHERGARRHAAPHALFDASPAVRHRARSVEHHRRHHHELHALADHVPLRESQAGHGGARRNQRHARDLARQRPRHHAGHDSHRHAGHQGSQLHRLHFAGHFDRSGPGYQVASTPGHADSLAAARRRHAIRSQRGLHAYPVVFGAV